MSEGSQTTVLRRRFTTEVVPGAVEALSSPDDRFFAFFNPADLSTLSRAICQLDEYVAAEGPFDAIMGFSAGAVLAASYLIEKQRKGGKTPFRYGLFLSSASSAAEMQYLGVDALKDVILIPTTHIWGSADETAPTGGVDLSNLCDPTLKMTLVHDGGHQMPRKEYLTEAVHIIRRTIFLAT